MEINRISARLQAQKREQKKDAAIAGVTGAFWGAAAGVAAGNFVKPDIFEYSQTIDKIGKRELKSTQKSLRKIAGAMEENKKLTEKQQNLLEVLDLADNNPKEIRKAASIIGRNNDTTAILNHLDNKIAKLESHIETLQKVDPNINPGSEMEKSLLSKFIQNNPNEFTVINDAKKAEIKSFKNIDEAIGFLKGRVDKYVELAGKTVKVREANLAGGVQTADFIKETFSDKKNEFRKFVVDEFKSSKAKKYALWGALGAGIAAAAADFASNARAKKVIVPVKTVVPVPVQVAVKAENK